MGSIIKRAKSVVVACDVTSIEALVKLVRATHDVDGIGGYKLGSTLAVGYSLPRLMEAIREISDLPVIYDHQKWGSDIPDTPNDFVAMVKRSGVDALILFPLAGPATQEACLNAAKEHKLPLLAGGEMTHEKFLNTEGGYIEESKLLDMYSLSARHGVVDFVVPGNKADKVAKYLRYIKTIVEPPKTIALWSPGFVAQGGKLSDTTRVAGDSFHAIVGRGIYAATDMHAAAVELTKQLGV